MSTIRTIPQSSGFYKAEFDCDSSLKKELHQALSQNKTFQEILRKGGLENLDPNELVIEISTKQEGSPVMMVSSIKKPQDKVNISENQYSTDSFIKHYVLYMSGLSNTPPTIPSTSSLHPQEANPSSRTYTQEPPAWSKQSEILPIVQELMKGQSRILENQEAQQKNFIEYVKSDNATRRVEKKADEQNLERIYQTSIRESRDLLDELRSFTYDQSKQFGNLQEWILDKSHEQTHRNERALTLTTEALQSFANALALAHAPPPPLPRHRADGGGAGAAAGANNNDNALAARLNNLNNNDNAAAGGAAAHLPAVPPARGWWPGLKGILGYLWEP